MSSENDEPVEESPSNTGETTEQDKFAELEARLAEMNDKYLRLYSEFDNFRKRSAKEKLEIIQMSGEEIYKSLLPVLDDLERAMKLIPPTEGDAVKEGVQLIYQKLRNALSQKGLEEVESLGKPFNTDLHEAISNIPAATKEAKGTVVDELEKGYLLNGKVIRFAKVIVGT